MEPARIVGDVLQGIFGGVVQVVQAAGDDKAARILSTIGVSTGVFTRIISDKAQLRRLEELVGKCNLRKFLDALAGKRRLPPAFVSDWVRQAGGYFPKLAQVLSVRSDLIKDREVLRQLATCLEGMPLQSEAVVREHLARLGWSSSVRAGVGSGLNAGSVAQVNQLRMADGTAAVVKIAWPAGRRRMHIDFRLFEHARDILHALNLDDEHAKTVGAMFVAVGKSEASVLREFDLRVEARALQMAGRLCHPGGEWDGAYAHWIAQMPVVLAGVTSLITLVGASTLARQIRIQVPQPLLGLVSESALGMTLAGGESMHALLSNVGGRRGVREEVAGVLVGTAVPLIGWLLLCKSSADLAHVDPHPGNFRWDSAAKTLWVLDWGSHVSLPASRRRSLCMMIQLVANSRHDENDAAIADAAHGFGVQSRNASRLAMFVRAMLNATEAERQEHLSSHEVDHMLSDVDDAIVPVVRCLATLGGMLKEVQRKVSTDFSQEVSLSLATMWAPFAEMGLR